MRQNAQLLKAMISNTRAHPTAVNSFNANHVSYDQLRPTYPDAIVKAFTDNMNISKESQILEIAAGTGKFTAKLVDRGMKNIKVVEPSRGMLDSFIERFPEIEAIQGSSYGIPLPDSSVDAIIVAQGFHWFSDTESLKEMRRVLKQGGRVGFIWNFDGESESQKLAENTSYEVVGDYKINSQNPYEYARKIFNHDKWNHEIVNFIYSLDKGVPQYRHGKWKEVLRNNDYFKPISKEIFQFYRIPIKYNDVYKYWETRSYITDLPEIERKEIEERVLDTLRKYVTEDEVRTINGEQFLEKYMGTHAVIIDPK